MLYIKVILIIKDSFAEQFNVVQPPPEKKNPKVKLLMNSDNLINFF